MVDLSGTSGLPLTLDESSPDLRVHLAGGLQPGELDVRKLEELRHALADDSVPGPADAYYMYRGLSRFTATDPETGRVYPWRYDVTVFPPGRLGEEYLHTVGHYHLPPRPDVAGYPEVYEVLSGSALFLLQRVDDFRAGPAEVRVLDFIALFAEAGTKALMLPDYGHWTVNATEAPLVVSNWICADCRSYYDSMALTRGACCHVVPGADGPRFVRNRRYAHPASEVVMAAPWDAPALGLVHGRPIFPELTAQPQRWRYLCEPNEAEVDLRSAIELRERVPVAD